MNLIGCWPAMVNLIGCLLGSLQILRSLETDEGKYECVAENSAGVVYSYGANLYVRGKNSAGVVYSYGANLYVRGRHKQLISNW